MGLQSFAKHPSDAAGKMKDTKSLSPSTVHMLCTFMASQRPGSMPPTSGTQGESHKRAHQKLQGTEASSLSTPVAYLPPAQEPTIDGS